MRLTPWQQQHHSLGHTLHSQVDQPGKAHYFPQSCAMQCCMPGAPKQLSQPLLFPSAITQPTPFIPEKALIGWCRRESSINDQWPLHPVSPATTTTTRRGKLPRPVRNRSALIVAPSVAAAAASFHCSAPPRPSLSATLRIAFSYHSLYQ